MTTSVSMIAGKSFSAYGPTPLKPYYHIFALYDSPQFVKKRPPKEEVEALDEGLPEHKLDRSNAILSSLTAHTKYARYLPEFKRRETWGEIVDRNLNLHLERFPHLRDEIIANYRWVFRKLVLPSMRSMQFAGQAIHLQPNRIFNCCYLPIDDVRAFSEIMFLLLGGTGVGFSVQKHHVEKLPAVRAVDVTISEDVVVQDSIEGWANAVLRVIQTFIDPTLKYPVFDYSGIRAAGTPLVTSGGRAPGAEPLKRCLQAIADVLLNKEAGTALSPIECHDIICHIADSVYAGGIRRAALISLFSADDQQMIGCKSGSWWKHSGHRARANNSVVLRRDSVTQDDFLALWAQVRASNAGEPGIYFTNDVDWGTNPCCEVALRPFQFCNLTEINAAAIKTQEDLEQAARVAAFIGTLQASYTDFHYLRPQWKATTERDALLGLSMTGIAGSAVEKLDLAKACAAGKEENARMALELGINPAARITCTKPAGTTSLILGCSSGIHAQHAPFYIRRLRLGKHEAIYHYLKEVVPDLLEDCKQNPSSVSVLSVPQRAPEGAVHRQDESALQFLERIKHFSTQWVAKGHVHGLNSHNVSATVSVRENEWDMVAEWMWDNREYYNGLSVLPYDGGSYVQAPFEDCTKEEFERLYEHVKNVHLSRVKEDHDGTNFEEQISCSGGQCTLTEL